MDKKDNLWIGKSWEDLEIEFKGSQENRNTNTKVKCPACAELGKSNINDLSVSVIPSEGKGHCFKCGTVFLIDKEEKVEKINRRSNFVPVKIINGTALSNAGLLLFRNRRISQETVKRFKIAESSGNIAFPFFKDGNVVNIKYRGIKEKKFSQSTGGSHIVFNYDAALASVVAQGSVIITEGEFDCMSFDEAGFRAVVSLDGGAPNVNDRNISGKFECIDNAMDLFDKAKLIYIATDNDENGKIAEKELVRRFGQEKVRLIDFGKYKDGNEMLMYSNVEGLQYAYKVAKEIKVSGIFQLTDCYNEVMDMITNGLTKGSTTYMPSIDQAWKWRAGEVNLFTGYNNDGKSTLLRYLEMLKAVFDGWKMALFVPEDMPLAEFMESMIHMYCGKPTDPEMSDSMRATPEQILEAVQFVNDHFFVVYPEDGFTLDTLFEKFRYLIKRHGVRVIDIDPYNMVAHDYGKSMREDLYISEFLSKCKRFALQNGVAFNIVAHQVKPANLLSDGNFPSPTRYNIKGGGIFGDKVDNVLGVWRPRRITDRKDRTVTFISEKIKKSKLVGEIGLEVDIEYDYYSNRYFDAKLGMKSPLSAILAFKKKEEAKKY